jgi:hypothetical protein
MADGRYWLLHDAKDVDDTIDEVVAARGSEASLSARLAAIVGDFETDQQRQDAVIEAGALRYEDSGIIRLTQLSWSQTSSGSGMWIADCYTAQSIDTIVSVLITSFGALKPAEIKTLFTYIPSSVSGMRTVRLVCDQNLASISSNPTLYLRVFGYGYQASSLQSAPASLMQAGRIDAEQAAAETGEGADA